MCVVYVPFILSPAIHSEAKRMPKEAPEKVSCSDIFEVYGILLILGIWDHNLCPAYPMTYGFPDRGFLDPVIDRLTMYFRVRYLVPT